MMTAEEAAEAAKGLTFEKVWAMFQETGRKMQEMSQETDRKMQEMSLAADRRQAELTREHEETERMVKELSKNIGGLNNSMGRFVEEMVSANLWEKFKALGYEFTKGGPVKFRENDQVIAQADAFLENGEYAMLVEVKTDLKEEDVDEHIERIEKVRQYMDKRNDKRKLVAAVAGAVAPDNVRMYALKRGLYVLVQSGDSVAVLDAPGFKAREW
jgi:hypothetical protein